MPRKTSFFNGTLLRSDLRHYWPAGFLYVLVWLMVLPIPLLQTGFDYVHNWPDRPELLAAELHNIYYSAMTGSMVLAVLSGIVIPMAVYAYLMAPRSVGLMHALPVKRTTQYISHFAAGFGLLTGGNVLIFLLSVLAQLPCGGPDWAAAGLWLLVTELLELFFLALGTLCAMATGWLLAIPVLYGAVNTIAILLHAVVQAMANIFYYGYYTTGPAKAVMWLTPVGRIWTAIGNDTSYWITADGRVSSEYLEEGWRVIHLSPTAYTTCAIYAVVGLALLALVWWLYQKRPSESAGDAMAFRWLRPIARWSIGLCGGWGLGLFLHYAVLYNSNLTQLLICQVILGVICFFAAQMLLQKKFRIFNKRWWLETAAMVLVLAAVTVCVKLDITGYQHRVPDADDVTSVRFSASYADFTADDPAAVESVISLHRAILEQYDETGERLENQTYLDTEGGPITRYVRVDYQLRNGTSLCREWRVSIVNGSDIHRLLTQLVSRTDCRESLMGLDALRKYGGVSNVAGGYVSQYETGAFADLTRQQAQDLVSHALADAANSRAPIDPLRDDMYSSTNLDIEIRLNTDKGNVSFSLNVPDFAVETKAFLDALEFEEPVDDTYDSSTVAVDEILYN